MFATAINYLVSLNVIALFVLFSLSVYFIVVFWVFIYKYGILSLWIKEEKNSLDALLMGSGTPLKTSMLYNCMSGDKAPQKSMLDACKEKSLVKATSGLSLLSIIATTSPFIGLFGTVVSILEAFSKFGQASSVTLNVIAPAISEALVATAAGIFVSIFAYTFHQILKRKSFELISSINIAQDVILSSDK